MTTKKRLSQDLQAVCWWNIVHSKTDSMGHPGDSASNAGFTGVWASGSLVRRE